MEETNDWMGEMNEDMNMEWTGVKGKIRKQNEEMNNNWTMSEMFGLFRSC